MLSLLIILKTRTSKRKKMYFCEKANMTNEVLIPDVPRDNRIGSAFNHLFNVIHQTKAADDSTTWNFSDKIFFHPFFLAPLAIYKDCCKKNIICSNLSNTLKGYFSSVHFENVYDASNLSSSNTLEGYLQKSYIPISRFTMSNSNVEKIEETLQEILEKQSNIDSNMKNPISLFFSELVDNIKEHSASKYGYIFSQKVRDSLYVIIGDNGKTIYKSYVDTNTYLDKIGEDEAKAIEFANNGYSTKDRPEAENRGFGLSKSRSMIVDGLGGAFFMLSGGAFYRHEEGSVKIAKLSEQFRWDGTIILVRIPLIAPPDFNYTDYLE